VSDLNIKQTLLNSYNSTLYLSVKGEGRGSHSVRKSCSSRRCCSLRRRLLNTLSSL